jgi:hypothetical protein
VPGSLIWDSDSTSLMESELLVSAPGTTPGG